MAGNSWKSINWKDPFLLEQQLTDDQRLVRDTAHQFGQEKLLPGVGRPLEKRKLTQISLKKWALWVF